MSLERIGSKVIIDDNAASYIAMRILRCHATQKVPRCKNGPLAGTIICDNLIAFGTIFTRILYNYGPGKYM